MQLFDLNSIYPDSSYNSPHHCMRRDEDEFREHGLCSTDPASTTVRVQSMRPSASWQSQGQELLVHGSVSLHGVRSTDLSRKSARYRNVPQFPSTKTLSHGIPGDDRQIHVGRCQRASRLSHLSGLRLCTHRHRQQALPKRGLWSRSETGNLCAGLNDYRSLLVHLPVGDVSKKESSRQNSYVTQRAGINSDLYFCDSRQRSRCQYDGCRSVRSRFSLYDGPRISRFQEALSYQSAFGILRHPKQAQYQTTSHPFRFGGQSHRRTSRSTVLLVGYKSRMAYPDPLRRVRYHDVERDKRLVFLTNNFLIPAKTIANIYRSRWQVELFFKWIKQHLRIKSFFGTSPNAVKTQIWTAVSVYLLVAIVKKRLNLPGSLHTILQILEVNLFEKIPISQLVNETINHENEHDEDNQLNLFT